MSLLAPLGLLALLGIAILILIYIIKPNYQQRFVSTTYVWKMSLKFRKRKLPTSKLRNFLLIVCQVLFLTTCAFIIARPSRVIKEQTSRKEIVLIIDSSASMLTQTENVTRFERAVNAAIAKANDVFSDGGYVSVIVADDSPAFLSGCERAGIENKQNVIQSVSELAENKVCSYGVSDVDGAISLCEDILIDNPSTDIFLYTDNEYSYVPSSVTIQTVSDASEWNVAILDAYEEVEDNYYTFVVDVATYGRNLEFTLSLEVNGANAADSLDAGELFTYDVFVVASDSVTQRIIFRSTTSSLEEPTEENVSLFTIDPIFSYQSVHVSIDEDDSFQTDNNLYIYGGQKEVLKIQYYSARPNSFFNGAFLVMKNIYADRWDIQFKDVKLGEEPETSGYDFYIYEHKMPESLPNDGVVLLVNPDSAPSGAGFKVGGTKGYGAEGSSVPAMTVTADGDHPVLKGLNVDAITLTGYTEILNYDAGYERLLSCDNRPMLLVKNEQKRKIAVLAFSLHYSSFPILPEFSLFVNNLLQYFMPATVVGNSFGVNDEVTLNCRGETLEMSGNENIVFEEFPTTYRFSLPGTYMFTQTTDFGKGVSEKIYVRILARESNVNYLEESIADPYKEQSEDVFYEDLLFYFALATVVLLFAEWILHSREGV